MFPRESRPLKRPRLGVPDFYPQENKQREVRRAEKVLGVALKYKSALPTG